MIPPSIPADEGLRLAALDRYAIVDTEPEEAFAEIVQLASAICDAPIALISLVDATRQWFKATVGVDLVETPRNVSFCAHAICSEDEVFLIRDTLDDHRFRDNPFVAGDPGVRFYAGAPLITPDGHKLGTLCVIDRRPRVLEPHQLSALRALARQVVVQLELRRQIAERVQAEEKLRGSEALFRGLADSAPIAIFRTNDDGHCEYTNRRWEDLSGQTPQQSLGRGWTDAVHPEDLERVLATWCQSVRDNVEWECVYRVVALDGAERIVHARAARAKDVGGWVGTALDITGRHRAEEALRSSEARLQRVVEGTNDGFWDWNVATGHVQFSPRAASMLGFALEEMVPHVSTWESLLHPEDRERVMARLEEHFDGAVDQYEAEQRLRCKDGSWLWVLDRGKVVERDPDGRPLRMAGTHTDISGRKEAERELDRFFSLSLDLLCIAGFDGYFKRVNPAFQDVLGYTSEELLSRPLLEFVHPDDCEGTVGELASLRRGRTTQYFENRYLCRDGSTRWIAWTASPLVEEGLLYAAGRDITRAKTAEQELRRSESRTRSIIDNALGGLITTNERGIIETVNPAAERMFGYSAGELAGRAVSMLIDGHYRSNRECLEDLRDTALGRVTEWIGRRKSGDTFTCELSLFEFYASDDQRHFAAHMLDVSERHEVERMKKDFISTVSHELRTPLTAIRGSLGLLAGGVMGELPPEARPMVAVAERNCIRLIALINDILDFDKLESGKMEMELRPTPLMRVLERSIESVSAVAIQDGVLIELHCANAIVLGDESRLAQVTVNLLSNAVKYSPRGATVSVTAHEHDGWAEVRVQDHGRGISPELQKKLFQRFQRVDSSDSRRKPGTGLGLAICKAIIEQHGGTIGVESREGEGSAFWFRVPSTVDFLEIHRSSRHVKQEVLIIEDDVALLDVVATQLLATGATVRTARSGWAGLAAVSEHTPSLIVLDVDLPDLDGYGVVAELRNHPVHRGVPLLVYTGMDLTSAQRNRLQLGPTRFLIKTRSSERELRTAVAELLDLSRARELA